MSIFALLDCNNFYVSCERVFNPALENKPIIILSSDHGCIVARSNEAKALGIPMGAPYFQYKAICQQHSVVALAANFPLYGDMSNRVMCSLHTFCPVMEIYSIDEAFLQLDNFSGQDINAYAQDIAQKIKQWTGIPVSIGLATTKVLAKIANHAAKKSAAHPVINLVAMDTHDAMLAQVKVGEIWGVGQQSGTKLQALNIYTAKQLRDSEPKFIRQYLGVSGERLVYELRGVSCLSLDGLPESTKNIRSARAFGRIVTEFDEVAEALAYYAANAAEKLRRQASLTQAIYVFLCTNRFKKNEPYYAKNFTYSFTIPTNDTRTIISAAKQSLKNIFQPGLCYKKTGIVLLNLIPATAQQQDLFVPDNSTKNHLLMTVLDKVKQHWGAKALFIAAQGTEQSWRVRSDLRSARYTTCWQELAKVR